MCRGIEPGHQRGARGRAEGVGRVVAREADTFASQRVEMRFDARAAGGDRTGIRVIGHQE
jgi:hypothetical protein